LQKFGNGYIVYYSYKGAVWFKVLFGDQERRKPTLKSQREHRKKKFHGPRHAGNLALSIPTGVGLDLVEQWPLQEKFIHLQALYPYYESNGSIDIGIVQLLKRMVYNGTERPQQAP
jgi:hypothetical protein